MIEINPWNLSSPPSRFDDFKIFFQSFLSSPPPLKKERTMIIYSMFHKNNRQMQRCVYCIVPPFLYCLKKKQRKGSVLSFILYKIIQSIPDPINSRIIKGQQNWIKRHTLNLKWSLFYKSYKTFRNNQMGNKWITNYSIDLFKSLRI